MALIRDVLHGLISKKIPLKPLGAVFVITDRCNARCKMCDIWKEKGQDLDIGTLEKVLERPTLKKIVNATLTGGEPTLRQDLPLIIEKILQHCPMIESVNITTNALAPNRLESIVKELLDLRKKLKPDLNLLFQISLDGPKDTHDFIRGIPGAFEKVIESVQHLKKLIQDESHVEIYHLCVLQPANIKVLDSLESLFHSMQTPVVYNILCDASYVLKDHDYCPVFSPEQEKNLIQFLNGIIDDPKVDSRKTYHYREIVDWLKKGHRSRGCGLLSQHIIIGSDGQIQPCLNNQDICYPKLKEFSELDSFWISRNRAKINRQIRKRLCPDCRAMCGPNLFDAALALLKNSFLNHTRS